MTIETELARYRQAQHRGNVTVQNYVRDVSALLDELKQTNEELARLDAIHKEIIAKFEERHA